MILPIVSSPLQSLRINQVPLVVMPVAVVVIVVTATTTMLTATIAIIATTTPVAIIANRFQNLFLLIRHQCCLSIF